MNQSLDYQNGESAGRKYISEIRKMMSHKGYKDRMALVRLIKTKLIQHNVEASIINDVIDSSRFAQEEDTDNGKIDKTISNEEKDSAHSGSL